MRKTIPLTQNQFSTVNNWWYDYLAQWNWLAQWNESTKSFYAVRHVRVPYRMAISMHRVVAQTPDDMECDHRNHNTLDNTDENLRNVTHSQSMMNRKIFKNNELGIAGVHKRASGKYIARLYFEKKFVLDKSFEKLEDAISARLEAEIKYFGQFKKGEI